MKKTLLFICFSVLMLCSCSKENEENEENQNVISKEHKENNICTELLPPNSNLTGKSNVAIINTYKWESGQTIRIKFLNGSNFLQEKVKEYSNKWTKYANLNFEFVTINENADIKISFKWNNDYGSWSYIGKSCQQISQTTPSMNFGWFETNTSETEFSRTILHEFGHAIGLIHEHQSPAANIPWNIYKVYEYYQRTQGWSTAQVDNNIFIKYSETQSNYSRYDSSSIMHYPVDASLTTNGFNVGFNTDFSDLDLATINYWYSFSIRSIVEPEERIDYIPWPQAIKSPNGRYSLRFFYSGSLCIFDLSNNSIIWQAGDIGYNRSTCELEANGNLILRGATSSRVGASKQTIWSSNTSEFPGARLHLQNDGSLVLIYNETVKWSSKLGKL